MEKPGHFSTEINNDEGKSLHDGVDHVPTDGVADGRLTTIPGSGCKNLHHHGSYPACYHQQPTVSGMSRSLLNF